MNKSIKRDEFKELTQVGVTSQVVSGTLETRPTAGGAGRLTLNSTTYSIRFGGTVHLLMDFRVVIEKGMPPRLLSSSTELGSVLINDEMNYTSVTQQDKRAS